MNVNKMEPISEQQVQELCKKKGIGIAKLRDIVTLWGSRGVTPDNTLVWYRLNALSQALFERERIERIKAEFVLDDGRCPYCKTEARPTGGKRPIIYCPGCEAFQVDTDCIGTDIYVRWRERVK